MTTDPFEQLRVADEPGVPDRRFVAGLRNRIVAALEAAGLPTIDLPDRSTTVTDTATTTATAATATAGDVDASRRTCTVTGGAGGDRLVRRRARRRRAGRATRATTAASATPS